MRRIPLLLAFLVTTTVQSAPPIEPGVSLPLAQWRARHYRDLRYGLRIRLEEGAERLQGDLELKLTLPARQVDLVLDWRGAPVRDVRVNDVSIAPEIRNEHLIIGRKRLQSGKNTVRLAFESPVAVSGSAVTRYKDREDGSEYLYSLLVPADASMLFPCFDQPDLKGRFSLELELPQRWKAVSNGALQEQTPGKIKFKETEPISTYLFAFAAGPFETLRAEGDPVRLLVRRSRLDAAKIHVGEVLRLNREATAYFERYFARKFPFAKYDLVLVPEFPYGGMEHAGATFLNEERVLFPAPPSAADILRRAQLIFHETSHQWFGDLVTMRWFDDLWLKEGFANFMAAKATEALLPQFDAWTAFHTLKLGAVRTDATRGTTAIRYPLQNLADAKSAYGAIVYAKGPAVLRQPGAVRRRQHRRRDRAHGAPRGGRARAQAADRVHAPCLRRRGLAGPGARIRALVGEETRALGRRLGAAARHADGARHRRPAGAAGHPGRGRRVAHEVEDFHLGQF